MRAAWIVALGLAAGCRVTGEFHCDTSAQCTTNGETGVCVSGSCAFGDTGCMSGWRFADSAAEDVAGTCLEGSAPADCATWKPRHFTPCSLPSPLGPLQVSGGYVYDTDRGQFIGGPDLPHTSIVLPQTDGTAMRIMSVQGFTLDPGGRLRVVGSLPLVIASWTDIKIFGIIDASSGIADVKGAGSNFGTCNAAKAGEAGLAQKGSGGGGGGGFGGAGGQGGVADTDHMMRAGGAGGAVLAMPIAIVHGGCPGAPGGPLGPSAAAPNTPTTAAAGGPGGGALQLTARTTITITGQIDASGGGGSGGPTDEGGGGGGGSGGFVGLEAPAITLAANSVVSSNGGGGGAGGTNTAAGPAGADGRVGNNAAAGGGAGQCASGGANGSAGATLGGANADQQGVATCGGGGGGGGAGVISVRGTLTMTGATLSPAGTIDPS